MAENLTQSAVDAAERIRDTLRSLAARSALVVLERGRDKELSLARLVLSNDLRDDFLRSDIAAAFRLLDRTLLEYQASRSLPDGHIMWAPTEAVALLDDLEISNESSRLVPAFEPRMLSDYGAKMTITTAVSNDGLDAHITFYRITPDMSVLSKRGRFAAIFREGSFSRLDSEVLLFNEELDAVSAFGYMFFVKKGKFERAFKFMDQMKEQAAETFDDVIGTLKIAGLEEFRRAATSDINMAAKIASIKRKLDGRDNYRKALSMRNLLAFLDRNPGIDVETEGSGKKRVLVFRSSPTSRFKILKLLDDDFLASDLTKLAYLVDSKGDPLD